MNFWEKLTKPILVLAPMADVTDAAFRIIIAKYGKPDVMWTEFVSADGLMLASENGKRKLLKDLSYTEGERPIVAQFFSGRPEMMEGAAKLARELGFDGIDINMGCPDKSIEKQGAGAAHMKDIKLAREVIRAAKKGAGDLPVSIKTRIGYNKDELAKWLPELLAEKPALITIHARTRKEMSLVPARWGHVAEAVQIRNALGSKTLIFGNGDVKNLAEARIKAQETGADGVMLGRAIFGNPWLFSDKIPTTKEKLEILIEHSNLFEKLLGDIKNFSVMKKHFKAYITGFDGASELRSKLMQTNGAKEVEVAIIEYLNNNIQ
ncbi:MAG: tRNA-dihydrouridine synthase [Candidatus Taylorbacteria bacterium]|nr:tRNA-dihydrouridine synthase [Candidatus Taylorbacteria bacterium]